MVMAKFKLNWGWSILLVYISFMTVFLFFFYKSFKELESNELVTDNYYQKELKYGEVLAKKKNADSMRIPVQVLQNAQGIQIVFPPYQKNISGNIILYKPDNQKLDQTIPINLDVNNTQSIPKKSLISGRWNVTVDWKQNDVLYFIENKLEVK